MLYDSYFSFAMSNEDFQSATSSPAGSERGLYVNHSPPSSRTASLPANTNNNSCVCSLTVKFLRGQDRVVELSKNVDNPIDYTPDFYEKVNDDYFPYFVGGKCVQRAPSDDDGTPNDPILEFETAKTNVQCLHCAQNGKYTSFKMYQGLLRFTAKDGYTRPKLVCLAAGVQSVKLMNLGVVHRFP